MSQTYTFRMIEDASEAYSSPNGITVERTLKIPNVMETTDAQTLRKLSETFVRFSKNVGFNLPEISSVMYRVLLAYLQHDFGMENPKNFLDKMAANAYTVEGIVSEAEEWPEDMEEGFNKFCVMISEKGGFARKVYMEFMSSLHGDEDE